MLFFSCHKLTFFLEAMMYNDEEIKKIIHFYQHHNKSNRYRYDLLYIF